MRLRQGTLHVGRCGGWCSLHQGNDITRRHSQIARLAVGIYRRHQNAGQHRIQVILPASRIGDCCEP